MNYTLKININRQKEQKVKEILQKKTFYGKQFGYDNKNKLSKREKMLKKGFNFLDKTTITSKTPTQPLTQQQQQLPTQQQDLSQIKPKYTSLPLELKATNVVPNYESWDKQFLPLDFSFPLTTSSSSSPSLQSTISYFEQNNLFNTSMLGKIHHYIHHPIPIKNEFIEKESKTSLPIHLTLLERKRFRRLKKIEKLKQEQEKVKFGLAQPKPPKLTYKNFMSILKEESVTDPTKALEKVKNAYEERHTRMLKLNEQHKLTKEQKREKFKRKVERDTKKELKGCLIRINKLTSNKNRFKIDKNGQQLYLTGICLMNRQCTIPNMVYVEGSSLQINKMKKLIMQRIKWNETEEIITTNTVNDSNSNDNCKVIWEGVIKKRYCEKWKVQEVKTEVDAVKILQGFNLDNFWSSLNQY